MLAVMNSGLLSLMMRFSGRGDLRDRLIEGRDWSGCWGLMRGGHIWPAIIGFIVLAVFLAAVVLLIAGLVRHSHKHQDYSQYKTPNSGQTDGPAAGPAPDYAALRLLDERYAKGEIEEEDYLRRKENIRKA